MNLLYLGTFSIYVPTVSRYLLYLGTFSIYVATVSMYLYHIKMYLYASTFWNITKFSQIKFL